MPALRTYMLRVVKFLLILLLILFPVVVEAKDRCVQYVPEIRQWSWFYQGSDYPYHYNVGQAQEESRCRADITSFDGGEGLFQFTGSTKSWTRQQMAENLDFYNPHHAIKAGAWYMSRLHKQNWDGALWLDYQAFNGGWTLLKKERDRAGVTNHELMSIVCKRKVITLKSGGLLDFCVVNYSYSEKIYRNSNKYRMMGDGKWQYWSK
jgi:hypothetical protein